MPVTKSCLTKLDLKKALFLKITFPLIGFLKLGTNEHPSLDLVKISEKDFSSSQLSLLRLVFGAKLSFSQTSEAEMVHEVFFGEVLSNRDCSKFLT